MLQYMILMEDLDDPYKTHTETVIALSPGAAIQKAQEVYPSNVIDFHEEEIHLA